MMEKEKEPNAANEEGKVGESEETEEALEFVLFQDSECYVYLVSLLFLSLFSTLYVLYESQCVACEVKFSTVFLVGFLGSH